MTEENASRPDHLRPLHARLPPQAPPLALAALAATAALVGLAAWLLPDIVYYPWIWRYYYGPIVADAAGHPVTRGDVTAFAGYNPVNTITWAIILAVSLWNVYAYLQRRDIHLTRTLAYAFLPIIAAGGTLRGLVDANWVPEPWAYLFITPNIYVVMFAYTFAALLAGAELERHPRVQAMAPKLRHWHVVAAAGLVLMGIMFAGVGSYILDPPNGFVRWRVLPEIFGYAALLTGGIVGISLVAKLQFARDPIYVLALYGQIVDGMQNYLGLSMGYTSKLMGTNFLATWFGDAGLLIGKVALIVPMLAYVKAKVEPDPETSPDTVMMLLVVILALGLAMGFHGGVGLLLGV